ncbi:hypothetical protein [Pseudomonas syringae]|uniref:hypothetical protein n=1 Tax=Pseudomonas syringae TaxID=317 RepID=UPI00200B7C0D|nr:hypothetical protein [Pseudomonas syringae]MCK9709879.1 hypothetical protein [Pseudomonas syringae pv. syringae]
MAANSDKLLPKRISKYWVGIPMLVTFAMLLWAGWILYSRTPVVEQTGVEQTGAEEFSVLNLRSDGCHLINDAGISVKERILKAQEGQTIMIPEGTRIIGDCLVRRKAGVVN